MTPVLVDGMEGERRGADDAPAEGRRNYDAPDSSVDRLTREFTKFRRIVIGFVGLGAMAFATLGWLGYRSVSPGQRVDQLDAKVDRNAATQAYKDSVTSFRVSRIERLMTTMAYQNCMSDNATPKTDCARIFTDGIN